MNIEAWSLLVYKVNRFWRNKPLNCYGVFLLCAVISLKNARMLNRECIYFEFSISVLYLFVQAAVDQQQQQQLKVTFSTNISVYVQIQLFVKIVQFVKVEWNIRCWSFHLFVSWFHSWILLVQWEQKASHLF